MKLATAFVEVRPDTKNFGRDLDREVTDKAKRTSISLGQVLGGAALLTGAKKAIDAAASLEQAVGGTAAVFGEASGAVDKFAKDAAELAGLSEAAARDLTTRLGGALKGVGLDAQAAGAEAIKLTQLGADLAATFGGTTVEAVEALSSSLRGEFDPLERYIGGINAAAVAAKAVELGLASSTSAVDANAKAQATLALVYERSTDAAGGFKREIDTASGAAAVAAANAENAAADLGENLLPIYTRLTQTVGAAASAFGSLPEPVQTAALALGGVLAVAGPVARGVSALSDGLGFLRGNAESGGRSLTTLAGRTAGLVTQLGLAYAAIQILGDQADRADVSKLENALLDLGTAGKVGGEAADRFGEDLKKLADGIEAVAAPSVASQIEHFSGSLQRAFGDTDDDLSNARARIDDLDQALASLAARDPKAAAAALDAVLARLPEGAAERLPALLHDYASALAAVDTASRLGGVEDMTEDVSDQAKALDRAKESLDLFHQGLEEAFGDLSLQEAVDRRAQAFADLASSIADRVKVLADAKRRLAELQATPSDERPEDFARQVTEAQEAVREALEATSLSLDADTQAARDNREAVRDLVGDIAAVIEKHREEGATLQELEQIRAIERQGLIEQLEQLGFNRAEIDEYIAALDAIPITKATTVTVDTAEAELHLARLLRTIALIPGGINAAQAEKFLAREAFAPGHALGGTVRDGLFTVGEQGAELLSKSGSRVDVIAGGQPVPMTGSGFDPLGEDQLMVLRDIYLELRALRREAGEGGDPNYLRRLQLELT